MIREFKPTDKSAVMSLSAAVGLFGAVELAELEKTVDQHLAAGDESKEQWFVDESIGVVGVAYAMPERMTEGTWNLLYIAVHPEQQKKGRGRLLLTHVESQLIKKGARLLLVETAGLEDFDYVRSFYKASGFSEEGRISDFYTDGMDKVVYSKRLK
jgi:ribosomal protein S18 acetylase RimI-like enzyme